MILTVTRVIWFLPCLFALAQAARADWKQEWEKIVAAAEKESEVALTSKRRKFCFP